MAAADDARRLRLLIALRDTLAREVLPATTGKAQASLAYAQQLLDRLCTELAADAHPSTLQAQARRCLASPLPPAASAASLQRLLSARLQADPTASGAEAAALAASLREEVEAHRPPITAASTATHKPIDAATLEQYLRKLVWPDAPELHVEQLQLLEGGRSKATLFATLRGHPHLDRVVLRQDVANGMIATVDGATRVVDEYPRLRSASAAGLPVPEPLWLEAADTALGAPFMLVRHCAGRVPGSWLGFDAPQADDTRRAVEHLAEVLAQLHRLPLAAMFGAGAKACDTEAQLQRELDFRWRQWREDDQAYPLIDCAFARLRHECRHGLGTAVPVHGDVLPHNLLVDGGRISALLDWEFAHPGDPAEDLAYCRAAVEAVLPWPQFIARYTAAGGPTVSERRLQLHALYALLRNSALLGRAARMHQDGGTDDFIAAAIAEISLPAMELRIARQLQALDALDAGDRQ